MFCCNGLAKAVQTQSEMVLSANLNYLAGQMVSIKQNEDRRDPHLKVQSMMRICPVQVLVTFGTDDEIAMLVLKPGQEMYLCDICAEGSEMAFDFNTEQVSSFILSASMQGSDKHSEKWEVTNPSMPEVRPATRT